MCTDTSFWPEQMIKLTLISVTLILFASSAFSSENNNNVGRQMSVHQFEELGLQIWLETDPRSIHNILYEGRKPVLQISTPPNVYPPLSMSVVSFANMSLVSTEFHAVFDALLETALKKFGLNPESTEYIKKRKTAYGDLNGMEVQFQARIHGNLSDVKIFLGKNGERGPVLLHASTLPGKMPHIEGQLRRNWGNIRYLK